MLKKLKLLCCLFLLSCSTAPHQTMNTVECEGWFQSLRGEFELKIKEVQGFKRARRNLASEIVTPKSGSRMPHQLPHDLMQLQDWTRDKIKSIQLFSEEFHESRNFSRLFIEMASFHAGIESGDIDAMNKALEQSSKEIESLKSKQCSLFSKNRS